MNTMNGVVLPGDSVCSRSRSRSRTPLVGLRPGAEVLTVDRTDIAAADRGPFISSWPGPGVIARHEPYGQVVAVGEAANDSSPVTGSWSTTSPAAGAPWHDPNLRSRHRRAVDYGIILPHQDGFLPY
jgi:hypothetical protein